MKYRQFNSHFWDDEYIYELSDREKMVFIFYFTNERVNMAGLYEMSDRKAMYYLNIEKKELEIIKKKFEIDRKYFFYQSWIYIANNHKNVSYSTSKFVIGSFVDQFNSIPYEVREYFFKTKAMKYNPPFNQQKTNYSFNKEMDMVMEKEMEMEMEISLRGSLPPSLPPRVGKEDVDPNDIPSYVSEGIPEGDQI